MAYEQLETLDPDGWRQSSLLMALITNAMGRKSTPQEFMPVEKPRKTGQQIMAFLKQVTRIHNSRPKHGDDRKPGG